MTNTSNVIVPSGGVSFETRRESYRGSVTVNGIRYRTRYCSSRRSALRQLNLLRNRILEELSVRTPKSLRSLNKNNMKTRSSR